MNSHVTERDIVDCMSGTMRADIATHLQHCDTCQAEVDSMARAIADCRADLGGRTARTEIFWTKQRFSIGKRLRKVTPTFALSRAWAAAMILMICAALLLFPVPRLNHAPQTSVVVQRANEGSDDLLLQAVAEDVDRDSPLALAAATLSALDESSAAPNLK